MTITLSADVEKLIRERVDSGAYASVASLVDEAVRLLVDTDVAEAELEELVQEGVDSGPATPMTVEDWGDLRRAVRERHVAGVR